MIGFSFALDWFREWGKFQDQLQSEEKQNNCNPTLLSTLNWKFLYINNNEFITSSSTELVTVDTYQPFWLAGLDDVNSTQNISSVEQFDTALICYEIKFTPQANL